METERKVGFIGAGRMAQRRYMNLPKGYRAVGVYDKPGARVDRYIAHEFDLLHVPTAETLIAMSDLVIVATSHPYLSYYAHKAHYMGRDVFIEKPGGIASFDLRGLAPSTRVGFNHRFWPAILELKRRIQVEQVWKIRATYGHGHSSASDWRANPLGGGELLDQMSHLVDLSRFLIPGWEPERVASVLSYNLGYEVEDSATVLLGDVATLNASWCEWEPIFRFELLTNYSKYEITGFPWEQQILSMKTRTGPVKRLYYQTDNSLREELWDMKTGGILGATVADAQATLRILEACREKAEASDPYA